MEICNGPDRHKNLSFGFLSSESIEIFNELFHFYPKIIAEGAIFEEKNEKDLEKIVDSERIKPKTQVKMNNSLLFS